MSNTNFGVCWGTPNGQRLSMPSYMASGNLVVAEAILRRWSSNPGSCPNDPNYGYNLTGLLSDDLSTADISRAQARASAEAQKDERVLQCQTTVTLTAPGVLTVVGVVTTNSGPFRMVLAVTQLNTTLLQVSS